jgi:hypothetical protein
MWFLFTVAKNPHLLEKAKQAHGAPGVKFGKRAATH